jgi:hypothetical protein
MNCHRGHDAVVEQPQLARQAKVLVLASGEPDYQDEDVHLGAECFIRRAA